MILVNGSGGVVNSANRINAGAAYRRIDRRVFQCKWFSWRRGATSGAADNWTRVRIFVDIEIVVRYRKQPLNLDVDQFAGPIRSCSIHGQREGVASESLLAQILAADQKRCIECTAAGSGPSPGKRRGCGRIDGSC